MKIPLNPLKAETKNLMLPVLFSFPEGILDEVLGFVGGIFDDSKLLIILALGVPLGFYVIKKMIGLMPKR